MKEIAQVKKEGWVVRRSLIYWDRLHQVCKPWLLLEGIPVLTREVARGTTIHIELGGYTKTLDSDGPSCSRGAHAVSTEGLSTIFSILKDNLRYVVLNAWLNCIQMRPVLGGSSAAQRTTSGAN